MNKCEPVPPRRQRHIGFELRNIYHMTKRRSFSDEVERRCDGMSDVQIWILGYLYAHRNADVFQRDLEEEFNIRRSSVSSVIGAMEEKGLIERRSVASDARLKLIVLTDAAVELQEMIMRDIDEFERRLRAGISDEELESFFRVLSKIKANLETIENGGAGK